MGTDIHGAFGHGIPFPPTDSLAQAMRAAPGGEKGFKLIGTYQSSESAVAAIERLKTQPGFCKHPRLIDPQIDDHVSGFFLDEV